MGIGYTTTVPCCNFDVVCWPRFVGFDGGGSGGSWLAGEEREANFPRI